MNYAKKLLEEVLLIETIKIINKNEHLIKTETDYLDKVSKIKKEGEFEVQTKKEIIELEEANAYLRTLIENIKEPLTRHMSSKERFENDQLMYISDLARDLYLTVEENTNEKIYDYDCDGDEYDNTLKNEVFEISFNTCKKLMDIKSFINDELGIKSIMDIGGLDYELIKINDVINSQSL